MHKSAKEKHFIKQPWYEGGPKALKQYIAEHLRYPAEALPEKVEGTVTVRYDIDHKGDVVDAKVIGHGLGHGCDEEAIRLVKTLKFKVEKPRGLRVIYHKTIQIHFKPPVVVAPSLSLAYSYTEKPTSKVGTPKESNQHGYTFSIIYE